MRENQKREGELVSLTEELQNELTRSEEVMEQMVQSYGIWIQRREEARRAEDAARQAEDAARQAENPFKKGHRKKSGLKRCRRYENRRSGRKRMAGKPEPLQESREFGGRPAVHIASDEILGVGEGKSSIWAERR